MAIVGRPNVGKSTLFNRLLGQRKAIVHDQPGVTRDRITETTDWAGHPFILLDTGGIIPFGESVSDFDEAVTQIARDAIAEAEHLDASMDHATLRSLDSSLGCGGVTFLEEGDDVRWVRRFLWGPGHRLGGGNEGI